MVDRPVAYRHRSWADHETVDSSRGARRDITYAHGYSYGRCPLLAACRQAARLRA